MEFEIKYDVFEVTNLSYNKIKLMSRVNTRWGHGAQVFVFFNFAAYCLKGRSIAGKLFSGFIYTYWINHFFTLGAYCGLLKNMPCKSS